MIRYSYGRAITLAALGTPLLITCDEPVIVNVDDGRIEHPPDCFITTAPASCPRLVTVLVNGGLLGFGQERGPGRLRMVAGGPLVAWA